MSLLNIFPIKKIVCLVLKIGSMDPPHIWISINQYYTDFFMSLYIRNDDESHKNYTIKPIGFGTIKIESNSNDLKFHFVKKKNLKKI